MMVMTPGLTGLTGGVALAQVSVYALRQYSMAFWPIKSLMTLPN